jgi:hypothetical protein
MHVLERLTQYSSEYQIGQNDQLWLVIDKDRWKDERLAQVAAEANQKGFNLAVSTPCFELWLYLHHSDLPDQRSRMSRQEVERELRTLLGGYNPSNLQVDRFEPYVDEAIRRAKALDTQPEQRWPIQLGTRVYQLVQAIIDLM